MLIILLFIIRYVILHIFKYFKYLVLVQLANSVNYTLMTLGNFNLIFNFKYYFCNVSMGWATSFKCTALELWKGNKNILGIIIQ